MNKNLETLAMVDIAYELIKANKKPMSMQDIFEQIANIKNISLEDVEKLTQLYMNIIESGRFVYCGDDKWDLKEGNLELWDTDGSQFIQTIDEVDSGEEFIDDFDMADLDDEEEDEDDEEEIEEEDDELEELDEQTKRELKEEKEYLEVELPLNYQDDEDDDNDFDVDDYDEDDYNKIMDDYEDMYD